MADQFLAEIRIFAGNFAPLGWAFCNGQLLPISQNPALFSLLGTFYGGDGKSTFGLPNLQGSVPLGAGQGVGLTDYVVGETGGSDNVTLLSTEMPSHSHGLVGATGSATSDSPANRVYAKGNALVQGTTDSVFVYSTTTTGLTALSPTSMGTAGGNQPHNNLMPYQALNFIISLTGIFPARS